MQNKTVILACLLPINSSTFYLSQEMCNDYIKFNYLVGFQGVCRGENASRRLRFNFKDLNWAQSSC